MDSDIETQRLENLRQKQKLLAELNLQSRLPTQSGRIRKALEETSVQERRPKKLKPSISAVPVRTSARIASSSTKPSYKDDGDTKYNIVERASRQARRRGRTYAGQKTERDDEALDVVQPAAPSADVDAIRDGWAKWEPTASPPTRDDEGRIIFEDFPKFRPNKSPEEIIREGAFGGSYFRPLRSKRLGIVVENDWQELPTDWVDGLDVARYLTSPLYDPDANKFKVACGQSIEEWEANGWIAYEYDIRGWFQWYCRFWVGRRCDDDERQISRWAKCVGPRGRWKRLLLKKYIQMGVKDVFDYGDEDDEHGHSKEVSPVMHQTCHHWAFEVRQGDLDEAWEEFR